MGLQNRPDEICRIHRRGEAIVTEPLYIPPAVWRTEKLFQLKNEFECCEKLKPCLTNPGDTDDEGQQSITTNLCFAKRWLRALWVSVRMCAFALADRFTPTYNRAYA